MMCTSSEQRAHVLLGVQGWEWPAWEGAFFPEDMPPEWRLTYFNTQFECVLLSASRWRGVSEEDYARWAEDTHDRFLFLLEGEDATCVPTVLQGRACCVMLHDARLLFFDKRTDLKKLAETLMRFHEDTAYLISQDGDLAQLERVRTLLDLLGRSA